MSSTLDRLGYEAGRLLKVFAAVTSAEGGPGGLLRSVGWDLPPGVKDVGLAAVDLSALGQTLDSLEEAMSSGASGIIVDEKFAELFIEFQHALTHLRAAVAGLNAAGDYLDKTQIKNELLPRLSGLLAAARLGAVSPFALVLLQFFGVVTLRRHDADPSIYQVEHVRVTVDWDALLRLFTDPLGLLESRYGWGTATFDGRSFVANLSALVEVFGEPVRVRQLPRRVEEQLAGRSVPEADTDPLTQLIASVVRGHEASGLDVGISLFPLRPTAPAALDAGIAVCPFVYGSAELSFPLSPELTLEFQSTVALDSGVALQFRPGHEMAIKAGLVAPGGIVDHITGKTLVLLTWGAPAGSPYTLLALPSGGVIEADSISFAGGVDVAQGSLSPSFAAKLVGGHALLRPDGADSFLASLIPANGVDVRFDLGVRWSGAQGFTFEGSASAEADFPLLLSIAGLRIDRLHVAVLPSAAGLVVELSVAIGAAVGPVSVSLERFGTLATLASHDGNLGPIDLSLNLKPPSGVGLVVDAAGVSGGGFLRHFPAIHEYSGVLQLQFTDLALQAFGLITTQVAGGHGYSLLALIDADFPPVQLGWGFTLNGVGGLLAVHRTASVDALRAALKANQLSTILFPKNAITNAPQILGQLDALFPTAPGRFLFGPMALIGWGTPTLLTAAIAVIIELPEPVRIILLARLAVRAPSESNALVRINMDALGVLDLSKGELALDARLYDSRLLAFTLSGEMALRATWAGQREFLLAIGGFHPRFTPPAGFPPLQRITIDMASGIAKLRLAAYLAITSNTVQFGANLDVFIGVSGFGLAGHLGFDALLQLDPFRFQADISGSVAITGLMAVGLDATLSGPAPWHIAGNFKFSILFWDVHVSFSQTWGEAAAVAQIDTVDVAQLLGATLAEPHSWGAQLPEGVPALVSARSRDDGAMVVHPLARLEVHERIVPLGLDITHFGAAPLSGTRRFAITGVSIDGSPVAHDFVKPVEDDFAPAQFFDLSDEEKLTRPSFERHHAGVRFVDGLASFSSPVPKTISYETSYIDTPNGEIRGDPSAPVLGIAMEFVVAGGAADRAAIQRAGRRKYSVEGRGVTVAEPAFVVVNASNLETANVVSASGTAYSHVRAALDAELLRNPQQRGRLQIVALHELGAA
jgi:hypothetical protein